MYRVLRGEMVKGNKSILEMASEIGITEKTLRNKINGKTDFTLFEARAIKKILKTELTLDELFVLEENECV